MYVDICTLVQGIINCKHRHTHTHIVYTHLLYIGVFKYLSYVFLCNHVCVYVTVCALQRFAQSNILGFPKPLKGTETTRKYRITISLLIYFTHLISLFRYVNDKSLRIERISQC